MPRVVALALIVGACSSSPPIEATSKANLSGRSPAPVPSSPVRAAVPAATASAVPSSSPTVAPSTPKPTTPATPVSESTAPGVPSLSETEATDYEGKCAPYLKHLRKKVADTTGRRARIEKLAQVLETDESVEPGCRDPLRKGLQRHLASVSESGAIMKLKMMLVGLAAHHETTGTLCPDAGPDANDSAWRCLQVTMPPSRFRFTLRSKGGSYTVSAVGKPIEAADETELFITGSVDDIELGAPVMRREPN